VHTTVPDTFPKPICQLGVSGGCLIRLLFTFCQWLHETTFSTAIRESIWIFPVIETTHVMALSLSVGTIAMIDLRLMGLAMRKVAVSEISKQLLPWALIGFGIMFSTGLLLFVAQPLKCYESIFFPIKMGLILLAGLNALVFQVTMYPTLVDWDQSPLPPFWARLMGALSLVLWVGVVAAGRTMAYKF
jgi:hypothetical protein